MQDVVKRSYPFQIKNVQVVFFATDKKSKVKCCSFRKEYLVRAEDAVKKMSSIHLPRLQNEKID